MGSGRHLQDALEPTKTRYDCDALARSRLNVQKGRRLVAVLPVPDPFTVVCAQTQNQSTQKTANEMVVSGAAFHRAYGYRVLFLWYFLSSSRERSLKNRLDRAFRETFRLLETFEQLEAHRERKRAGNWSAGPVANQENFVSEME